MYLLTNGRVITRDEGGKGYYEKGAVAYEGTEIVEVGEEAALRAKYPQAEIIDAKGGVIMPAFINAHTHIYSALARGLSIAKEEALYGRKPRRKPDAPKTAHPAPHASGTDTSKKHERGNAYAAGYALRL